MQARKLCGDKIIAVPHLLTEEECQRLIQCGEESGFKKSPLSGGGHGRTGAEDPVTSSYCVMDDENMATLLWKRCRQFVPMTVDQLTTNPYFAAGQGWVPQGVFPRLRLYKYDAGDAFPEHIDYKVKQTTVLEDGSRVTKQSVYTLLVYLNNDFTGGRTGYWPDHKGIHCRFLREHEKQHASIKKHQVSIKPQTGLAVLQDQNVLHEGLPVKQGTKYILRTDIVFQRSIPRNAKLAKFEKEKPIVGSWERLFETSCKNYAI
eukprot:INCI69.1.p1 GENE.INCI69.1~~INCI69.1.p1  ORF type:complete len:261 (+),score=33.42 INCI69.1:242-1024(+)